MSKEYLEFRVLKLQHLLIPTIQHELKNTKDKSQREHYKVMLSEYQLELKERRVELIGYEGIRRVNDGGVI